MFFESFKPTCRLITIACWTLIVISGMLFNSGTLRGEDSAKSTVSIDASFGAIVATRSFFPDPIRSLEPIEMTVAVEKPFQYQIAQNDLLGDYGDFFCEFLGDEEGNVNGERNTLTRRWKLYPRNQSDAAKLPPIPIRLELKTQATDNKPVVIVIPATTLSNPPEKSNVNLSDVHYDLSPIPRPIFFKVLLTFLLLLVVLAIVWRKRAFFLALINRLAVLVAFWRGKPQLKGGLFSRYIGESPFARAIRELDQLKTSEVYLENKPVFYSAIDDILRRYLLGEFQINASEMTSNEIISTINASPSSEGVSAPHSFSSNPEANEETRPVVLSPDEMKSFLIDVLKKDAFCDRLSNALNKLDLAKFAKISTTFNDASDLYSSIRLFIEQASSQKEMKLKALDVPSATTDVVHNVAQSQ